jgi:UDP-glucuronate decarboxylase
MGREVVCVDNFSTGVKRNVVHLMGHERFELIRHDVTLPLSLEVDEIFNLACPASPVHYQSDPVRTTKTTVHGAINMLELARSSGAKILQASTSEVYGDPEVTPQSESYWGRVNPIGIRSCYDEGKRCAETLFFDYHRQHRVPIRIARIFNTYGPRMHPNDGRVVSSFVVQALRNAPLRIFGDGSQTRSLCYVDDLVDALTLLMDRPGDFTGPVNLGNASEIRIDELAHLVIEMTNSRSKIVREDARSDDPRRRRPDLSLAREVLQWSPGISIRRGLESTIAYFEGVLGARRRAASSEVPATCDCIDVSQIDDGRDQILRGRNIALQVT